MNKEDLLKRLREIEDQKAQKISLINQHNAAINQLQAQYNGLEGSKQECELWLKKLEDIDSTKS